MGNKSSKSTFRNAIIYLNISADPIGVHNDKFWSQIFSEDPTVAWEVIKSISIQEIRMLRDGSPKNFATLIYKMVERLCLATGTLCNTSSQQTAVLNSTRILIRIIPSVFEDADWRDFFETNHLSTSGELREEPKLIFVEKDSTRKDYASYLPTNSSSSTSNTPSCSELLQKQTRPPAAAGRSESFVRDDKESRLIDKTNETNLLDDSDENLLAEDFQDKVDLFETKSLELNERTGKETNLIGELVTDPDDNVDSKQQQQQQQQQHNHYHEPQQQKQPSSSLMSTLIQSICDLLFCPEFTVLSHDYSYLSNAVDAPPEDLKSLSTCDYVWEPGVGFDSNVNSTTNFDRNRSELMRLLLACLSVTLYQTTEQSIELKNNWLEWFVSQNNRHTLPLFTSFLNVILSYKPSINLPTLLPTISKPSDREELVELSIQILIATLDYSKRHHNEDDGEEHKRKKLAKKCARGSNDNNQKDDNIAAMAECNLFIDYLTRIHREEDLSFLVKGFSRLLGNRLELGGYLISKKQIEFEQELLILFWKICSLNQRFVQHLLKSNEILDIILPLLYHMNENFQDPSKTALIHICVFNLLILSGERNFGVKLNKPYTSKLLENLPEFTGTHADLLIIVFHKLIMYGYDINQLYDYLMTIVANISPYLKNLNLLSTKCLIQLFETFSSVYVIFTEPFYHSMVVFLLEIFNNIIQYQFDGNTNLVYMILIKKDLFINLANLSTSQNAIDKILRKLVKRKQKMKQLMSEAEVGDDGMTDTNKIKAKDNEDNKQQDNDSEAQSGTPKDSSSASGDTTKLLDSATNSRNNSNNDNTDNTSNNRRQNLATVSASSPQSHHNHHGGGNPNHQYFFKQEVSLVETPDLNHVTQPIHPYDPLCGVFLENKKGKLKMEQLARDGKEGELELQEQARDENGKERGTTTINLVDDLLNDKNQFERLSWPPTTDQTTRTISDDLKLLIDNCSDDFAKMEQQQQQQLMNTAATTTTDEKSESPDSSHRKSQDKSNLSTRSSSNLSSSDGIKFNKWKPTSHWLKQWKQSLPLQTVLRTIEVLVPQIEQLTSCGNEKLRVKGHVSTSTTSAATTAQDESEIIKFLQSGTLVGLLPVPHPILIRKYRTNNGRSTLWFRCYTWGIIYVRNSIWTGTHIRLIKAI